MKNKRWRKAVRAMKKAAVVANANDAALSIEPDGVHVHVKGANGVPALVIVRYCQIGEVKNIIPRTIRWLQSEDIDPKTSLPFLFDEGDEEASEARLH